MKAEIPEALAGERIDRVVAMLTGLPRSQVAELVGAGAVRLAGGVVSTRSTRVRGGDRVEVDVAAAEAEPAPPVLEVDLAVVHADDDVIVVDKAPGVVVHPGAGNAGGTLAQALLARYPELAGVGQAQRGGVVHRLDKGTSGLLVVARSPRAYESLVAQLGSRLVERRYLALVWGCPRPPRGLVDAPIGRSRRDPTRMTVSGTGREARTAYEVQRAFGQPVEVALVGCRLETGRTHQIRVHLSAIGHPVVGDARYRGRRADLACPRPFLHAERLDFDHPGTGERLSFSSPLPPDLSEVLSALA
ncbi:MAG: RluA family pseudouridine synthase [Actinomycetota bacterium]|nr:RluA family pseudouridine synthase [Actinomycetota bacterium]